MMERQGKYLVRLVDDLMDVSRITRGKIELRRARIELADVVRDAIEISKPLIDKANHQLTVSLPPQSLVLHADAVRLNEVFTNLLSNAAKYTDEKGQIYLTAYQEGNDAVVSVRDNGIGISPEMLPHVFEMFAQQNHASPRAQSGLGIGLTLVRSLVQMHGGRVEAKSEGLGRGTEFIVRLPLIQTSWPTRSPNVQGAASS
jgi:signal transduction histidine kinase